MFHRATASDAFQSVMGTVLKVAASPTLGHRVMTAKVGAFKCEPSDYLAGHVQYLRPGDKVQIITCGKNQSERVLVYCFSKGISSWTWDHPDFMVPEDKKAAPTA